MRGSNVRTHFLQPVASAVCIHNGTVCLRARLMRSPGSRIPVCYGNEVLPDGDLTVTSLKCWTSITFFLLRDGCKQHCYDHGPIWVNSCLDHTGPMSFIQGS